jgi:hypothetical protein
LRPWKISFGLVGKSGFPQTNGRIYSLRMCIIPPNF